MSQAFAERSRLQAACDVARQALGEAEAAEAETRRALDAERADVVRLEGFSFERFAATFRGTRSDDLMRERAEQARAEAAHATAVARVDAARADAERLSARIAALGDLETWRRRALDAKEEWLRASGHADGQRLDEIAAQLGAAQETSRQIDEALLATGVARNAFDDVLKALSSAESWATFDLFGGGMLTDLAKHSHIDQAQRHMRAADAAVRHLKSELADVGHVGAVESVGVTEGTRLMDYFFDDIFSAMSVRRSVVDSRARAERARESVQRIEHTLAARAAEAADEVARLRRERDDVLES